MKLNRAGEDNFVLKLGSRERVLLVGLLRLYPCVPSNFMPISKSGNLPDAASSQKLIDEALAEQRSENKRQVRRFIDDRARWHEHNGVFQASFSAAEIDWLLEILNDIRIGSWMILGSPEERLEIVNQETAPHLWAMEMAVFFQMRIIHSLDEE
ncbi:MAG: hypothetical protein ACREP9_07745 [Candidatus Dormibacteraceae bacterium]